MAETDTDTIFALATAPGRAGIAVIRISGTQAGEALRGLAGAIPPDRLVQTARFRDSSGADIDRGLMLFFAGPRSFTGEDVAELHVHGGRAVIGALLDELAARPHMRVADPGEFTRRAFENGKLDLTAAEAIADLVAAETTAQRRQAMRQLAGDLGRLYESWRERLLRSLAHIEAEIDFPEEGLPDELANRVRREVQCISQEISSHLADNRRGERLRAGISVAIIGPPNAGKSSLLNALARRDVAITSPIPGTTRDVIEVGLDLAGYPVTLADTAGLRDASDAIEEEGVRRARNRAASADLRLAVLDATRAEDAGSLHGLMDADTVLVMNKMDLVSPNRAIWADELGGGKAIRLSVMTGEGMPELLNRLSQEVEKRFAAGGAPLITRARHREALEVCRTLLGRFENSSLPELAAEDLRGAVRSLGRITGRVDVEDVLDVIFREFCIGK